MSDAAPTAPGLFPTTLWSMVGGMREVEEGTALAALERLARAYWRPLHGFLLQRGVAEETAADLVQGFFAHLISKEVLLGVEQRETRFRTFLLTCFTRWLSNQRRDAAALLRGGGVVHLPVQTLAAHEEPSSADGSPEHSYDRHWARTLYDHALERLDAEIAARDDRREFFHELRERVAGSASARPQWEDLARRHGMNTSTVRKAAHDLRQRFATLLRHEVRKVVANDEEVDEELRHLVRLLAG